MKHQAKMIVSASKNTENNTLLIIDPSERLTYKCHKKGLLIQMHVMQVKNLSFCTHSFL